MKVYQTVARITAHLHRNLAKDVLTALKEAGVKGLHLHSARSPVIEEKTGLLSLLPGQDLAHDPIDTIFFLVSSAQADALVSLIIDAAHLKVPGRGSVLVEDVELLECHTLCCENGMPASSAPHRSFHLHPFVGICCIVQRGQADVLARIVLDSGTCVPTIHFGTGTGVRDKMGLLRITIPAEKEILLAFASLHEADGIMDKMVDAGRLDRPGSGFIYAFPVKKGLVNIRVRRGGRRHAASIEQIVTAVDHLQGNTEWRHWRSIADQRSSRQKSYIYDLVDLVLLCNGGTGTELVHAAMAAGAGGATMTAVKHIRSSDSLLSAISPARDMCHLIIPRHAATVIVDAVGSAGAFSDRCHGQLYLRQTAKAFTYMGG